MNGPVARVLSRFELDHPFQVVDLGSAGGFSGAQFWRISDRRRSYYLRRWPAGHPLPDQLTWIHRMLERAAAGGFPQVPVPVASRDGRTIVEEAGALWELEPELPGKADFRAQPRIERLHAAAQALGRFHAVTANPPLPTCAGPSPTVADRLARVARWRDGGAMGLLEAVRRGHSSEIDRRAWPILHRFLAEADEVERQLRRAASFRFPLAPAIRDIWCDNVLFQGDAVTGIVDFGSLAPDWRVVDVARLVGSMAQEKLGWWQAGLEAYESVMPLDVDQRSVAATLARSAAIMGGMIWLDWLYVEKRVFADWKGVLRRLDDFLPDSHPKGGVLL